MTNYRETFMVYKSPGLDDALVTGDEMDWETGWRWQGDRLLLQDFQLPEDEAKQVAAIARADKQ
jgi:hypothetical protein